MVDRYRCGTDSNWTNKTKEWQIDIGVVPKTQNEHKMIGRWSIDIGVASTQTRTDKMTTDRYRCGPNSNWTQNDRNMANRYRCGPKTQTWTDKMMTDRYRCGPDSNWIQNDRNMVDWYKCGPKNWINVTRRWSINIGATPTQTQTNKMMNDRSI